MRLIDGRAIAKKIEENIRTSLTPSCAKGASASGGNSPLERGRKKNGLAAILVGKNPASQLYIALKEKAAKRTGIKFIKILYPINNYKLVITNYKKLEEKIIKKINQLNNDKTITGIIIQLPLPKNLDTDKIINAINPKKDADGFHPQNQKTAVSPVLQAAIEVLKNIKAKKQKSKKAKIVLVSNSKIFPLPFQAYFGKKLTVCKFKNIKKCLPSADIIITAIGKKHYLKGKMVKNGAVIIDIGIVREGKKVFGDADAKSLAKKAGWLTPVPGGVGPVTVACLLKNAIKK